MLHNDAPFARKPVNICEAQHVAAYISMTTSNDKQLHQVTTGRQHRTQRFQFPIVHEEVLYVTAVIILRKQTHRGSSTTSQTMALPMCILPADASFTCSRMLQLQLMEQHH